MPASNVTVFCRTCGLPRYRSVRPLNEKDRLDPRLFQPVDSEIPPAADGAAQCYLCMSPLTFVWENKGTMPRNTTPANLADAPPAPPARHTPEELLEMAVKENARPVYTEDDPLPAPASAAVETLFELREGEELKSFEDTQSGWIVITNRRIVRVRK